MARIPSPSRRRLVAIVAAGALAVPVLAVATAPPAAADPGKWTQLSNFTNATRYPQASNIDVPTIARFGGSVQVVWSAQVSSGAEGYFSAQVDGSGSVVMPQTPIITNWAALTHNPALISLNGQRFLAFSGLNSTTTGAPYTSGAEYFATSGDGKTWSLGAGTMSNTRVAYGAYGNDVVDMAGTPVWVGNAGTTTGIRWHVGTSGADPAPEPDGEFLLSGCCAYYVAGARDPATGAVYAGFYSNSSATSENGIQVGQILPGLGAFSQAPGSVTIRNGAADSVDPGQKVAMTGRPGGGVYVAYKVGYPTPTMIRVLKVGTNQTMDVPGSKDPRAISMSAGPDGRLWVAWVSGSSLRVAHTNAAATQFGAAGSWGKPKGTSTMWHTAASAAGGGLDVAVMADPKSAINAFHIQALRTLSVKAPGSAHRGSKVTITVTDAGDPVAGAKVVFGGRSGTTNGSGKVELSAPGGSRAGIRASKSGYHPGATSVRLN